MSAILHVEVVSSFLQDICSHAGLLLVIATSQDLTGRV